MKKLLCVIVVLIICMVAGCDTGNSTPHPTVLTNATQVPNYLAGAQGGDTVDNPVPLTVSINAAGWEQLFDAIAEADKYVDLDLSRCSNVPATFNIRVRNATDDKIASIVLPQGITAVGNNTFNGCRNLSKVTLPAGVTSIDYNAFVGCTNLTEINLPEGLTKIESDAFGHCTSLTEITLPASVTSIDYNAFAGCRSLTEITLPASITSIRDMAFVNCTSLALVICLAVTPPELGVMRVFDGTDPSLVIKVPAGSVAAYQAAWIEWADLITAL